VIADVAAGSHTILIGLVTGGHVHEVKDAADGPLVYWYQNYGRWSDHQSGHRLLPEEAHLEADDDQPSGQ
jgi:hypothetical protein